MKLDLRGFQQHCVVYIAACSWTYQRWSTASRQLVNLEKIMCKRIQNNSRGPRYTPWSVALEIHVCLFLRSSCLLFRPPTPPSRPRRPVKKNADYPTWVYLFHSIPCSMWCTIDFMDACYCWSNQQPAASNIRNDENPTCSATATCAASSRDAASNCNSSNRKSNRYTWPCHECSHYAHECSPKPLFQWAVYIRAVLLWAWFMVFFPPWCSCSK